MEDKEKINDLIRLIHCLKWFDEDNMNLLHSHFGSLIIYSEIDDYANKIQKEIEQLAEKHNYFALESDNNKMTLLLTNFILKRSLQIIACTTKKE